MVDRSEVLTHVGVVVEVTADLEAGEHATRVMSKWGRDGEYLHGHREVPSFYGQDVEYWTERS